MRYAYSEVMPPTKGSKKKSVVTAPVAEPIEQTETLVVDSPKKKAKKAVKVVAIVTPQGIEGSFQAEPRRPLIVHLGISTADIAFHGQGLQYNPNTAIGAEPEPYDASVNDMFVGRQEEVPEIKQAAAVETTVLSPVATVVSDTKPVPCFTKLNLMVQFKDTQEAKTLPNVTNVACFWCAHTFDYRPCIIPEREVHGVYNVYGNFCSPECGVAYLLKEGIDPHVRWERMALLHRIYDREGKGQIFPAPARECLTLFGGPMTIDVFRSTVRAKKVRVDLHMPPMVSILGSIDTKPIDFFDTAAKNVGGVSVAPQRSVEEGLRLQRKKPLKDKESTLDTVMNIKINTGGRRAMA
jgi:hypothetical protein